MNEPRPAATVVVLRDSPRGLEVLLTVRTKSLRFMGGAVVFPGGAIAAADFDPRWERVSALSIADAAAALPGAPRTQALGAFVCALREAFEEVGLVVGDGAVGALRRADASSADRFLERCLELGVVLATDRLVPAGRSVTPLGAPIRFDTFFFLISVDATWEPKANEAEVESWRWATPAEALDNLAAGEAIMAPPTIEMLQRLNGHADVASAMVGVQAAFDRARSIVASRLSPVVQVVLAPNPGLMTGPGTNTYVVGNEATCVIDPAVDDDDFIAAVLRAGDRIESILVTHRHADHVGGVRELARRTGAVVRAYGDAEAGGAPVQHLGDGDVVDIGATTLRALHTPGHSSDHLCFFMDDTRSLFSGDNVLGEGTSVIAPPDGDMRAYLASLERLKALPVERIYPGHWHALAGAEALDRYIAHRAQRERSIVQALEVSPASLEEIVKRAYTDTSPELHEIARLSALAHLQMLESDGVVSSDGALWRLERRS